MRRARMILISLFVSLPALAMEVSMMSGGYRTTEAKANGSTIIEKTELQIAGRIFLPQSPTLSWYGLIDLNHRSYDVPSPRRSPKGSTSLSPGAGIRFTFSPLSNRIAPFIGSDLRLVSERDIAISAPTQEVHTSGVYYQAHTGFRFSLSTSIFMEIEATLLKSALSGRRKVTSNEEGNTSSSETKTSSLWVESQGGTSDIQVALGIKI